MSIIKLADGTEVSDYSKPYIIAEVNSSHNGNVDVAKRMIDAALDAGCDCVKFQSWSAKSLYSKTYYQKNPIAKRFVDKLSLSTEELLECANYCHSKGIGFSSTPYSKEEVDFLVDECNVPFIKISSMEVNNPEYIKYIAEKQIPIIISTGMADYDEVKKAISIIEETGNKNIAILHCVTVYPTPIDFVNLNNIIQLREMFPTHPIGFSDHTMGDTAAVAATVLGAAVIEKHITLDAKKIGMDNQMAMEPDPLKELVKKCKAIPQILGTRERILHDDEVKQKESMRRSIVARHVLPAGHVITDNDLDVKRPGIGIAPEEKSKIIGKKVLKDIDEDTVIQISDIEF